MTEPPPSPSPSPSGPDTPATPDPGPLDPTAEPFEPGPANLSGCGKPAVIGCLVVLVVLAVGLVVLISQSPRLMRYVMGTIETQVTAALPADLEEAERERLETAFDNAIAALMEGRVDSTSMANLQRLSAALPARGETLSREEVVEIIRLLEEIAAVTVSAAPWRGGVPAGAAMRS